MCMHFCFSNASTLLRVLEQRAKYRKIFLIRKFTYKESVDLKKVILKCVSNDQEIFNNHKAPHQKFNTERY